MDAIRTDVDVALDREIALFPGHVLVLPAALQSADGGCRKPRRILAEQDGKCLREIAGGDVFEAEDPQQRLERFGAPHVGSDWVVRCIQPRLMRSLLPEMGVRSYFVDCYAN